MQIGRIEGATRVMGKSQGYLGLPVRDEKTDDVPCMVTSWHPTPKELAALNAGAPVHVRVLGRSHPPISVGIGPTPEGS